MSLFSSLNRLRVALPTLINQKIFFGEAIKRIVAILFLMNFAFYPQSDPFADSVVYFHKGTGSWANQNPPYFPENVLGAPSATASETVPASAPEEICSLGLGGEIVLEFTDNAIVNGDGIDFTVFENAFRIMYGPRAGEIFAEPGKVAVSKDGITFYEFPYDSLTLEGLAGKTPTNGSADPTNPDSSGGDGFDLSVVGLDTAYFVKITDVTEIVQDTSHPYYDPTANGFDLDAIAAVHSRDVTEVNDEIEIYNSSLTLSYPYPNPISKSENTNTYVTLDGNGNITLKLYDVLGRVMEAKTFSLQGGRITVGFQIDKLPSGIYFLKATGEKSTATQKIILLK